MSRYGAGLMAAILAAAVFFGAALAEEAVAESQARTAPPEGKELEKMFFEHFRHLPHQEQLDYFYGLVEVMVDPEVVEEREKKELAAGTPPETPAVVHSATTPPATATGADAYRYVDPATGRVFVFDETINDFRQESGSTPYTPPQRNYYQGQPQQNYYQGQRQSNFMDKVGSFFRGY